jgi:hypothetical protein
MQKLLEKPDSRKYKDNDISPKVYIFIYLLIFVLLYTMEVQSIIAGTRLVKITCWLMIKAGRIGMHQDWYDGFFNLLCIRRDEMVRNSRELIVFRG